MTIKEIRKISGLSQREFAYKYNIPVRTIENWESESPTAKRRCPDYVVQLLERVVREDFPLSNE